MTLITVGHSNGERRRCDAKCYDAQTAECDCVCGGLNHGAGLTSALDQTGEIARRWMAEAGVEVEIPEAVRFQQVTLFEA